MSRIADLGKNYEKLPDLLAEYDEHITAAPARLAIKGKILDEALKEQAAWPVFYDHKRAELSTLVKFIGMKVDETRSRLLRNYTENYSRALSDRIADKYIDKENDFLLINELYLEVSELAEKFSNVVDAFKTRGFALRDIVAVRVNKIQDNLL